MEPHERIILALDGFETLNEAIDAVQSLKGAHIVKMHALIDHYGDSAIHAFAHLGHRVFADMKIFDTPESAAQRTAVFRDAGADFLSVHANGGEKMMQRCVKAADGKTKILAATVLSSFTNEDSLDMYECSAIEAVQYFAYMAKRAGAHGVIASPQEARFLREAVSRNCSPALIVTPGIRPVWAPRDDQKRTATPAEAIRAGADYLVIGRPIFRPPPEIGTPREAFERIVAEIASASVSPLVPVDNNP